ncbi:uncharacterized protein [Eleutherodactylus coqui]|uniref:uncharacterized protein n=1 Tax=Eleutherodactylus coqui TaxID=57060 RepID=UPI00346317DA
MAASESSEKTLPRVAEKPAARKKTGAAGGKKRLGPGRGCSSVAPFVSTAASDSTGSEMVTRSQTRRRAGEPQIPVSTGMWSDKKKEESVIELASKLAKNITDYNFAGKMLVVQKGKLRDAKMLLEQKASKDKQAEARSAIKKCKDCIKMWEAVRAKILEESGPFKEKILNDDRFAKMAARCSDHEQTESSDGEASDEEFEDVQETLEQPVCSQDLAPTPRGTTSPRGKLPEEIALPSTSGESEVEERTGRLQLQKTPQPEASVHMEGFMFGDELPEQDTKIKRKKKKPEKLQEKLVFVPGSSGLAAKSDQSSDPKNPPGSGSVVGLEREVGEKRAQLVRPPVPVLVGNKGKEISKKGAVKASTDAGRGTGKEGGSGATNAASAACDAEGAVDLKSGVSHNLGASQAGSRASSDAEAKKKKRKSKNTSKNPEVLPSTSGEARTHGPHDPRKKVVDPGMNVRERAADVRDKAEGTRSSAVAGPPGTSGTPGGQESGGPGDKVVRPEGSWGPVAPPAATTPGRSYASVAAGGEGSSLSPGSREGVLQQRLLEALRKGESTITVGGREVDLSLWKERHGLGAFREQRGETVWSLPTPGQDAGRRNVVRLRWRGNDACPPRARVVELLLKMGFRAVDIFALIHPYGTSEFDISFVRPEGLEIFWGNYELVKNEPGWRDFAIQVVSRQNGIKKVTVLTRNESLSCFDIMTWLSRYGEVTEMPQKNRDEHGIWSGAWTFMVKLKRLGNSVAHIPSAAFLGRDRILAFYQGQPKLCHRCGDPSHLSAACKTLKCALCGGLGHLAASCAEIRCNLCGDLGHPFSRCPRSFANAVSAPTDGGHDVASGGEGTSRGGGAQEPVKNRQKTPAEQRRQEKRRRSRELTGAPTAGGSMVAPVPEANLAAEALRDSDLDEEDRRIQREETNSADSSHCESVDEEGKRWLEKRRKLGATRRKRRGDSRSSPTPGQVLEGKACSPPVGLSNRFRALQDISSSSSEGEAEGKVPRAKEGSTGGYSGAWKQGRRGRGIPCYGHNCVQKKR